MRTTSDESHAYEIEEYVPFNPEKTYGIQGEPRWSNRKNALPNLRREPNLSVLSKAKNLSSVKHGRLWTVYGKSGAGKTVFCSTFPKPMLYAQFGDDGSGSLGNDPDIDVIQLTDMGMLKDLIQELRESPRIKYKTFVIDTFSLIVQEWIDENATQKKYKMTQQMWGELGADTTEAIRVLSKLSKRCEVVLACHEKEDIVVGMEDEISPTIAPNLSPMARPYLQAMTNIGVHIAVRSVTKEDKRGIERIVQQHIAQLNPNAYYWCKVQKAPSIKLPDAIINPSFDKIMAYLTPEQKESEE